LKKDSSKGVISVKTNRFVAVLLAIAVDVLIPSPAPSVADQGTRATPLDQKHRASIARIEAPRDPHDSRPSVFSANTGLGRYTITELMKLTKTPGVSIAVFQDSKIIWTNTYGVADVVTKQPVTAATLFQAASISKPVAAMAVLKAVQDGKIGLDDDVNSVLKSWKLPDNAFTAIRKVTPRMLLSHTGGTTVNGFKGYHPDSPIPTAPQVLGGKTPANSAPVVVDVEPFTLSRYSGGGFTILQLVLEDALGKPFPAILAENVLGPIGMNNSGYDQPPSGDRSSRTARAHSNQGEAMDARWHVYPELAAAGLWTTPSDLAMFAIEVQLSLQGKSNRELNKSMSGKMVTPVGVGYYGLGFATQLRGDAWYFEHSGGNWGFRCDLIAHRDKGYGAVIMTNSDSGNDVVYELRRRIAIEYKWDGDFSRRPDNWPE
jgi:CubicO group peptidase (beta-lactamase class C family)